MDDYNRLRQHIMSLSEAGRQMTVCQGIVKGVSGNTCDVMIGGLSVPDVRLRASLTDDEGELLIVPKVGSAVVVGSLTGDYTQLVVLQVDHVESIVINGGKLGGLVNIEQLTEKLNALVNAFNNHTHVVNTTGTATAQSGTAQAVVSQAQRFAQSDYEDTTIKH